ncbi:replication protein [Escherichia coli]|nr:replication protein [Escherichia coli]
MEVYTRVFALDMAATLAVPFTGDGRDAAEILRNTASPEVTAYALPYISSGQQNRHNISWSMYISCSE